jgi:hypothetical protein
VCAPARAPAPITVGIDGGYLRHWQRKQAHFVAIVGESVPTDEPAKCFGLFTATIRRRGRHLAEVLRSQGLQHNQELVFLSDGEERPRQLQCYLRPHSQHWLDWLHLTMQLTGLGQSLKGLVRLDAQRATELQEALEHAKWDSATACPNPTLALESSSSARQGVRLAEHLAGQRRSRQMTAL